MGWVPPQDSTWCKQCYKQHSKTARVDAIAVQEQWVENRKVLVESTSAKKVSERNCEVSTATKLRKVRTTPSVAFFL